ncbi:ATP-binding protein [Mucilaginibacter sp. PAMB04274]|uniref:ATP-binding protein n=1 Tax=Mucilaginibacter sp. PAMB04274 TaxID=3138568 RepID=UPI0031F6096D
MLKPDITNCDREPIHNPGRIQAHGFLVAVDEEMTICYCSENISQFLVEVSPTGLLGQEIESLEGHLRKEKSRPGYLRQLIYINDGDELFRRINTQVILNEQQFNLIINGAGQYYLLEFEPEASDLQSDLQQLVGRSLSEMLSDRQLSTLLSNTSHQIRQIIQYDRVMVYKFHEDGHGEVIAESKNDQLASWLGLHYPASDIPKQARELYKQNLVRLIANVSIEPSTILTRSENGTAHPLDLTCSTLRAVSPIHIQYLKNMGVASSFSVSILDQDKLWGLIACHNYTPRFINFRQRESAKLIGQVLSSAISFRQQEENQQKAARLRTAIEKITRQLLRDVPVQEALFNQEITLQDTISSTGAVLYYENTLHTTGLVPNDQFLNELISWLNNLEDTSLFETACLSNEFPPATPFKNIASGLLACRLSPELKEYMLWFRPEFISTIKWAGNPDKPVEIDPNGLTHISPRHSFEEWSQLVKNHAVEWEPYEREAALLLKDEVNYAISRKATELRVLNEKLREAYSELDTFSYTISHDLKNPLTTIKSYSQLIQRQSEPESKIRDMAGKIIDGASRMQAMIEEVLNYSKTGQDKMSIGLVDMQGLLAGLRHDLLVSSQNPALQLEIGDTPALHGDKTMIMQVFSNLIGNAVKYSGKTANPVVRVTGEQINEHTIRYAISDNGIGIKESEHQKIFELFSRSANVKEFEGTGVGLAIVKRIIEKHHGQIWVESQPGSGSVFFVEFKESSAS